MYASLLLMSKLIFDAFKESSLKVQIFLCVSCFLLIKYDAFLSLLKALPHIFDTALEWYT